MRTISALLQSGGNSIIPNTIEYAVPQEPLEAQVASIRAEIAAAIAQAHSHVFEDDDVEEDVESGQELASPAMIGPNTSGIRGDDGFEKGNDESLVILEEDGEDDDGDAFPIPLRTRRAKELVAAVGSKRKR